MILSKKTKQPNDVIDYDIDYSPWLRAGDTITQTAAKVECLTDATDTALQIDSVAHGDLYAKVWHSGGTDKQRYKVTVTVTTAGGRVDESEYIVKVKEF